MSKDCASIAVVSSGFFCFQYACIVGTNVILRNFTICIKFLCKVAMMFTNYFFNSNPFDFNEFCLLSSISEQFFQKENQIKRKLTPKMKLYTELGVLLKARNFKKVCNAFLRKYLGIVGK